MLYNLKKKGNSDTCNPRTTWMKLEDITLSEKWSARCSVKSNSLQSHGSYSPWNSPGQNTGVGSHSLLQGIFPTWGKDPGLSHCRQILYQFSYQGSPRILEWVAYPFFGDLPDPGTELGSPALQADSLPTELSGKPMQSEVGHKKTNIVWFHLYEIRKVVKFINGGSQELGRRGKRELLLNGYSFSLEKWRSSEDEEWW